jgi:hypothetical protein
MRRSQIILGIMVVFAVSLILISLCRKPQADGAALTVRFVGITNEAPGRNLALFALSNAGDSPIEVGLPAEVELRNKPHNNPGRRVFPALLSPSGQPLMVKVVPPQTPDQWRVTFDYYRLDLRDRLSRWVAPLGIRLGRQVVVTSAFHSEWIDPTVPIDWLHL